MTDERIATLIIALMLGFFLEIIFGPWLTATLQSLVN